ncbi:retrotransposon protein, putative, ty1-copia subclass [Tanacetum coccineum]
MHNMGKTVSELHAMLIEYEKGLPKKAEIPQVMMIKGGKIHKSNKKSLKAKVKGKANGKRKDKQVYIPKPKNPKPSAKEHPAKDDTCHHCKEVGHYKRNCPAYLAELIKKKKQVDTASSSDVFKNEVGNQLGKTIKALRSDRGGEYISQEFKDYLKDCGNVQKLTPPYTPQHNKTATRILNMVPTKKVDKTPYELWYVKVPNLSYLKIWGCEALVKRDTPDKLQQRSVKCIFIGYPKETMSYYFYFLSENKIVVARTHRAPDCLCLNVEVEEYSLGDLNEPTNYKAALLDLESDKWVDAMNAEMQSMKDNQVWYLVDLPPNSKGFTQTYGVDYEETFSSVADIRAIRILIAIAAFYDYEIWKMDVKTSFLNGYLDEDIYMILPNAGYIPMQERLDLNKTQGASTPKEMKCMQNVPYALAVGSIMYAVRCTRPDVAFAQNLTSLDCYCDAGFETDRDDIKSQTVYVFVLNGGTMDWKSSKQSTTAMSATEAEYIAALEVEMEAVWIMKFISELAHTDDNLSDPFTKALPKGKLTQHARSMGLHLASSFM